MGISNIHFRLRLPEGAVPHQPWIDINPLVLFFRALILIIFESIHK